MAKEWYVELSKPAFPYKGYMIRVFRREPVKDALSPTLCHLFRVHQAENRNDAIAQVIAGKAFTMISPSGTQLEYGPNKKKQPIKEPLEITQLFADRSLSGDNAAEAMFS